MFYNLFYFNLILIKLLREKSSRYISIFFPNIYRMFSDITFPVSVHYQLVRFR